MNHLNDDDLVLVFYGEADAPAGAPVHLEACPECQGRLTALRELLGGLAAPEELARDAGYGARVWARLAPRLEAARRPPRLWARRAAGFGALAASLVGAFLLGRHSPRPADPLRPETRERILLVSVSEHLERSQVVLVELLHADGSGPVDVAAERAKADDLVSANRLFRANAVRTGEPALAGVLEELEHVLVEVARGPDQLSPAQLRELWRRIEARGILFRVRVIQSHARERGAVPAPPAHEVS